MMMKLKLYAAIAIGACLCLFACNPAVEPSASPSPAVFAFRYHITQPDEVVILPDSLREISGVCSADNNTILSVQDELGIVFFFDLRSRSITRKINFAGEGDYEGVALSGDSIFVLKSNGQVSEITGYTGDSLRIRQSETHIPAKESEGFCFDPVQHQLLIGCKSKLLGENFDGKRGIFGFDPARQALRSKPDYLFDPDAINTFATEQGIPLPKHYRKKSPVPTQEIRFRISGMAFHPITGELYLLSAEDHLLFIISRSQELRHIQPLPHETFNKAEGITFLSDGEMLISNEAQDKRPTLLRFRYQRE